MLRDFRSVRIFLDRTSDGKVSDRAVVVSTDRQLLEALSQFNTGGLIHVVGDSLCQWATLIGRMRGAEVIELVSPTNALIDRFGVGFDSARYVASQFEGIEQVSFETLTVKEILGVISREYSELWSGGPNFEHAAEWLQWWALDQHGANRELVSKLGSILADGTGNDLLRQIYSVDSRERAVLFLSGWTGLVDSGMDFPAWSSKWWLPAAKAIRDRLATTFDEWVAGVPRDQAFQSLSRVRDSELRKNAARVLVRRLVKNDEPISILEVQCLRSALPNDLASLKNVKVDIGDLAKLPGNLSEMVEWYARSYRQWLDAQALTGLVSDEYKLVGGQFAKAYLDLFPRVLASGGVESRNIIWKKSAELLARARADDSTVTILLVLDGVGPFDLDMFLERIEPRITSSIVQKDFGVCPPPTVTHFAKQSVVAGRAHEEGSPVAPDVVGHKKYHKVIELARDHNVITWTLTEPDATYHQQSAESPFDLVRSLVNAKIQEVVELVANALNQIGSEKAYEVVITADHGRLMFPSERIEQQPAGLETHGRAAWHPGGSGRILKSEYEIEGGVAWLNPSSYGIGGIETLAVRIDDASFTYSDGRVGLEAYPHGGLFPEEVMIPWVKMRSGKLAMRFSLTLSGDGVAGRAGDAILSVVNSGDLQMTIETITIGHESCLVNQSVGPKESERIMIGLQHWPALETVEVFAEVRAANGNRERATVNNQLGVSQFQTRDEFDIFQ